MSGVCRLQSVSKRSNVCGVCYLGQPMSEYLHVEKPFLDQLAALGWTVIDQGQGFTPSDPAASLRGSFREWLLPEVFRNAVRTLNRTADRQEWLTDRQLDDLRDQILRQPSRTLLEANEAVQACGSMRPVILRPRPARWSMLFVNTIRCILTKIPRSING
ncbi:MAG: hypothetical protein LZF62_480058 [Nitrospira sp.]|nr:MAG: hypothetical protein LZF62_480058 [Nitrospira sp.]